MTKSLFELLTLIEAYEKQENFQRKLQQEEHKKYFIEMQKMTLRLIQNLCKQKRISITDYLEFYKEVNLYLKDPDIYILNQGNKIENEILWLEEKDRSDRSCGILEGYKIEEMESKEFLFQKIMGKRALMEKQHMEKNLKINIDATIKQSKEYNFLSISHYWRSFLQNKKDSRQITKIQYEEYLRNIEYISNYYWSIKIGQQKTLALILTAHSKFKKEC